MPTFPTAKSKEPVVSICGGFIKMSDGSTFTRKVLDRGVMKKDVDTEFVETELEQLDAKTFVESE